MPLPRRRLRFHRPVSLRSPAPRLASAPYVRSITRHKFRIHTVREDLTCVSKCRSDLLNLQILLPHPCKRWHEDCPWIHCREPIQSCPSTIDRRIDHLLGLGNVPVYQRSLEEWVSPYLPLPVLYLSIFEWSGPDTLTPLLVATLMLVLFGNAVVIGIFGHTTDPISAHSSLGPVQRYTCPFLTVCHYQMV